MKDKLCLLICRNFRQEAEAVIKTGGFDNVKVVTFPASCGHIHLKHETVKNILDSHKNRFSKTEIIGGPCIQKIRSLSKLPGNVHIHKMDQCFYLFANRDMIDAYLKAGAHLQTPGYLQHWRKCMNEHGFDRKTAREFYRESTSRLILLDTGVNKNSARQLKTFAAFVDRPFDVVATGLDHFMLILTGIIRDWYLEKERDMTKSISSRMNRQLSEYSMVHDMIARLAGTLNEEQVVESIFDLFKMLFAPVHIVYLPFVEGNPGDITSYTTSRLDVRAAGNRIAKLRRDHAWTKSGSGFLLRITHRRKLLGIIEIEGLAFPHYKDHYLNIALAIVKTCGLAIDNARTYQQMADAQKERDRLIYELQNHQTELEMQNEELRAVQGELEESRTKYADLYDFAPLGYFTFDTAGLILGVNLTGADFLKTGRGSLIKRPFFRFIHSDDRSIFFLHLKKVLDSNARQYCECRLLTGTDFQLIAHMESLPILDDSGEARHIRSIISDITERKKIEYFLAQSTERLFSFMESATDGFVLFDQDLNYLEINDAGLKIFPSGTDKEGIIGKNILDISPELKKSDRYEKYLNVLRTGEPFFIDDLVTHARFGDRHLSVKAFRVGDGLGIIFSDITERKLAEQERDRLYSALEDKNRDLEQVIRMTSHDLRSPLIGIQGFSRELEVSVKKMISDINNENISINVDKSIDDIMESLKYIYSSTSKMDTLLKGLINVLLIGQSEPETGHINMVKMMSDITGSYGPHIKKAGITVETSGLPECIGNKDTINRLFSNLIENALKYLDPERKGMIRISGHEDKGQSVYCIEDNGIGIAPKQHAKIFDIFHRLDLNRVQGEGLGLTIVRKIVEKHGGKIWVESDPGVGSKFFVSLPNG